MVFNVLNDEWSNIFEQLGEMGLIMRGVNKEWNRYINDKIMFNYFKLKLIKERDLYNEQEIHNYQLLKINKSLIRQYNDIAIIIQDIQDIQDYMI
jgi:hypothetical protein